MLLRLETTAVGDSPATDLGYLLGKHPGRCQTFSLSYGHAHVFYTAADAARCEAALLMDVDPVRVTRGRDRQSAELYVNDRAYVASSLLSTTLSQVYGSALNGRCRDREDLAALPRPLTARLDVLPSRGLSPADVFEPLGYAVEQTTGPLDPTRPDWGERPYRSVTLRARTRLADLLEHLYVLVPAFDGRKHYFVDAGEVDKLVARGGDWLASHPLRNQITRRALRWQSGLVRHALSRLADAAGDEAGSEVAEAGDGTAAAVADRVEAQDFASADAVPLNTLRHEAVFAALLESGAASVLDLGCAEGQLVKRLRDEQQFRRIVGADISTQALQTASRLLRLDQPPPSADGPPPRVTLIQASATYRDDRLAGFDAAAVVEVIEHLDPPRLAAFEAVLFEHARPRTVVLTTPNGEYNVLYPGLAEGAMRHPDHRFEWSRRQFADWSEGVATRHGYDVRREDIGAADVKVGSPTQMAVFTRRPKAAADPAAD